MEVSHSTNRKNLNSYPQSVINNGHPPHKTPWTLRELVKNRIRGLDHKFLLYERLPPQSARLLHPSWHGQNHLNHGVLYNFWL